MAETETKRANSPEDTLQKLKNLENPKGTFKENKNKLTDAQKAMIRVEEPEEYRPYEYHRPNILRFKGSVLPHVIIPTIVVTIFAAIITALFEVFKVKLNLPNTFTPILGIVVGLLLTYRTNTAYDRFWEGRKIWSAMVTHIRHLTRYIWVGIREDELLKNTKAGEQPQKVGPSTTDIILEKATAINLLLGFAVAVKHFLREESGCEHLDLEYLISNIRETLPSFKPLAIQGGNTSHARKVGWFTKIFQKHHKNHFNPNSLETNLPLEITLYLSSYIQTQFQNGRIDVPINNQIYASLNGLCDCLSHFERILRSPIPLAYSIHLSQTVWIYCLSLPFQLVDTVHWSTIIVVFFSAYILFGLERIGAEIENPFGYDENDLKLDDFCGILKRELKAILSHEPPSVNDWIYSKENRPFEKDKDLSALDASKLQVDDVRSLLSIKEET
ncbi:1395_t:CDS:2 [Funneliformis geosporum]|uniref:6941_t:CDS:1 n=1 Tax=Funneliformis geosporum TaxID=1117311 RepID=A0A9W4SQ06_9GLOM|nr:1395_t:CDS:2 [Funneliformis geosporum]CAI2177430.1 6941_t:CDS:2 [Funneliformis geosporum]